MKQRLQHRAFPELDAVNDGRHVLRDLPLERESISYTFVLPDHDLAAFCYTWVNKDSKAGSAFVVFGAGTGGKPIAEAIDGIDVPATMNFDDWRVGAVHLKHDLKFKHAEMILEGQGARIHAHFEAFHPPYAYGSHPDGCPDYAATNRIEQAGRVHGTIRIGDKHIDFQSLGARDHSWGTRDWQTPQHWKWLHAQAGPDLCVHFWQFQARGKIDLRGYVLKDGVIAEMDEVDVRFDHDAQFNQKNIEIEMYDTLGRVTHLKGLHYAHFPLVPGPHTTLNEGAMRCEIDGRAGMGWSEFMWPTNYLEHLRLRAGAP
ncbi:hypothetical protein [uncultured Nevskia sp.]|uniref:DUF7064 domain-containing protein n=1 Tax=uncultured Nevskia sp. TaxID=228950 RepID=UPI0025D22634|nr:hypothetical protein [uncultured Nevskia sp.]